METTLLIFVILVMISALYMAYDDIVEELE